MKKLPIIILHGWNLSGARFAPLVKEFEKEGFSVFAPDLPGFGNESVLLQPFTLGNYTDFVNQFLKKKKIKKCILVGHSFGGRVALIFQKNYPGLISHLILTGVPIFPPIPKLKVQLFLVIAKIGGLFFQLPPLSFIVEPFKKILYKISGSSDYYRTEGVMRETFRNVVKEDLLPALQSISIPLLMIWGENDLITPVWIAEKAHALKKDSQLVIIPNERHMVPVDEPKQFTAAVFSFIKKYEND